MPAAVTLAALAACPTACSSSVCAGTVYPAVPDETRSDVFELTGRSNAGRDGALRNSVDGGVETDCPTACLARPHPDGVCDEPCRSTIESPSSPCTDVCGFLIKTAWQVKSCSFDERRTAVTCESHLDGIPEHCGLVPGPH